jgi:chorismate synthase
MSSTIGETVKLSIFGESHGAAIGVVIDGLPAGETVDMDEISVQMSRRAPGHDKTSTKRSEKDIPEILSGVFNGRTTGAPLCAVIRNRDTHSSDYKEFSRFPRPGHADYTAFVRYGGFNDYRGGGHFSGRLTAPMVFAGSVCRGILKRRGITIGAHISQIAGVKDSALDPVNPGADTLETLSHMPFPVIDANSEPQMREVIEDARKNGDSVGGVIECAALGLPCGLGSPIFGGVENRLSAAIFGIPAVKGIEFGSGFGAAQLRGSENNDSFCFNDNSVKTSTNNHGGILGGITSGMPIIFRTVFKPTPSIFKTQTTVDLKEKHSAELNIKGRHDPCVVIRAVPAVEAMTAFCLLDLLLGGLQYDIG